MKKVPMKKLFYFFATMGAAFVITSTGCKKNQEPVADPQTSINKGEISLEGLVKDLKTIRALGFDVMGTQAVADGYIVEGDIHLSRKFLDASVAAKSAQQEQYSTQYKIATSGVRTINVALTNSASAGNLNTAFNNMVKDLNDLKLPTLKFARVTDPSKAEIVVAFKDLGKGNASGVTLGRDGSFVNPSGNPGSDISLNSNPNAGIATSSISFLQSVLDHEFGHAIGLRHTDYHDRIYGYLKSGGINPTFANQDAVLTNMTKQLVDNKYGAGTWDAQSASTQAELKASVADEGDGDASSSDYSLAKHLYGTPLTPTFSSNSPATDPLSIMLSYANSTNLTFSAYDTIGLFDLYGNAKQIALIKSYLTSEGAITAAANAKGITTVAQVVTAVKAAI